MLQICREWGKIVFKYKWESLSIRKESQLNQMIQLYNSTTHAAAAFDTECTGLHHIHDKPFLYQFGWVTEDMLGYTFTVDLELQPELARRTITIWQLLVLTVEWYVGHNIKFDLHMCENIHIPYRGNNVTENQTWIRLGSDAIPERAGGVPMKLKQFCTRYVDRSAADADKLLQEERASIAKGLNVELRKRLDMRGKDIEAFFKDKLNTKEDLPIEKQIIYEQWLLECVPLYLHNTIRGEVDKDDIRYDTLDRDMVDFYGHKDIILTLESFMLMKPIVCARGNMPSIEIENKNIYPLLRMEREGYDVDFEYLLSCQKRMKEYIRIRRKDLCTLAGQEVRSSQSALILNILNNKMNVEVSTTESEAVSLVLSDLKRSGDHDDAVEFIETLQELRTLEKWYSTYLHRFISTYRGDGKIYTTIHQAGTVSGRVTSDFQQFPKDAIVTVDGEELFHPRKLVVIPDDGKTIGYVYLDYSQIELRLQAMYTILVGEPDKNLCRAYFPYLCHTWKDGNRIEYDCRDRWCIKHAYDMDWYENEAPEVKWKALDVHGATTKMAFEIDETHPDYHKLRYKGKRVNFSKNYGAQFARIKAMFPEYDDETCHKIDDAYYLAFPGVKAYHQYCYTMASIQSHMTNMLGTKYYGASGHNLINMLIQGTGAYFLKWKIALIDKYLIDNHCKSTLIMQIHDELQFKWNKEDSPQIFYDIKQIMEDWEDGLVPIIADMEVTTTDWANKYEVEDIHELQKLQICFGDRS